MTVSAPRWSEDQLRAGSVRAIEIFRELRMQEPLEAYLEAFDQVRGAVENLLELSVDLSQLDDSAVEVLTDPALLEAVRYLAGPPISADDLRILIDASIAPTKIRRDPALAQRIIDTIMLGLDRNRFPWVPEDREPTPVERDAAALASAALIASRRVMTSRANESKDNQEQAAADRLADEGFAEVPARAIPTLEDAPKAGQFCHESLFGSRKADLVIRLWDNRVMPLECKVSRRLPYRTWRPPIWRLNDDPAGFCSRPRD